MLTITRKLEFDAGHRIPDHRSQCRNLHGHRYVLEITLQGDLVETEGAPDRGMVMDFADVKSLATAQSITPDTTMDDVKDLMGHSRDELKDLTDKAKGADWDKDFIGKMVDDHQKVLDRLTDAAKNTADTTLVKALTEASGKVQEHLTKAQELQAKLK